MGSVGTRLSVIATVGVISGVVDLDPKGRKGG